MKQVTIVATGSELLQGNVVDTNSSSIARKFFGTNFSVREMRLVGDIKDDLERVLRDSITSADIIIITGGLGPTDDDCTIEVLQRICNFSLMVDPTALKRMESFFSSLGIPVTEKDKKMAEIPADAVILRNNEGLAPGFILNIEGKHIVALPGVPVEMNGMMEREVLPYFREKLSLNKSPSFFVTIAGMKESEINRIVAGAIEDFTDIEWGICAGNGLSHLTFTSDTGTEKDKNRIMSRIRESVGNKMLDGRFTLPEEELIHLLREQGLSIACAESCTGGLIGKRITDIAGASDVFRASVVAYDNQVKEDLLGVPGHILKKYGAVSEETARAMAAGVRTKTGAAVAVSTTGIAGPGGGTEEKPAGTICFGFTDGHITDSFTAHIRGSRERVRMLASLYAIEKARRYLRALQEQE